MNPLRQDDPRHERAVEAATVAAFDRDGITVTATDRESARQTIDTCMGVGIATYFASLKEQGVVLVEAYAGDDAGPRKETT